MAKRLVTKGLFRDDELLAEIVKGLKRTPELLNLCGEPRTGKDGEPTTKVGGTWMWKYLPKAEAIAILMVDAERCSISDVARVRGVSMQTVKRQLAEARRKQKEADLEEDREETALAKKERANHK
jgi:hypothetical protein